MLGDINVQDSPIKLKHLQASNEYKFKSDMTEYSANTYIQIDVMVLRTGSHNISFQLADGGLHAYAPLIQYGQLKAFQKAINDAVDLLEKGE